MNRLIFCTTLSLIVGLTQGASQDTAIASLDISIPTFEAGKLLDASSRAEAFGSITKNTKLETLKILARKDPDQVLNIKEPSFPKRDGVIRGTTMYGWWRSPVFPNIQFYISPKTKEIVSVMCTGENYSSGLRPRFPNGLGISDTEGAFFQAGMISSNMRVPDSEVAFNKDSMYLPTNTHLYVSDAYQLYFKNLYEERADGYVLVAISVRFK